MKLEEIYEYLCYYDRRSPHFYPEDWDDDAPEARRKDCSCDNCFYGRDRLAMELVRLHVLLEQEGIEP